MRKIVACGAAVILFAMLLCIGAAAADDAVCINKYCSVTRDGTTASQLLDGNGYTRLKLTPGTVFSVESEREIAGLYLEFCTEPGEWTLTVDGAERLCGKGGYLHEYVPDVGGHELTLRFDSGELCDVYMLSKGERPDWVQDWQPVWDRADVMLLPTHSDDDELYFAGVIPWCLQQGARVQVVYFVSHNDDMERRNELLDGLWAAGLRNYPVLGIYNDLGHGQENQLQTYAVLEGKSWEDFERRQVELYRRFRPQVVIAHAEDGEYGHGAHKLYHMVGVKAAEVSGDPSFYPESAEKYGVWTPPKVYAHNFPYNRIYLELDTPLSSFGGRTAFEVSREAFRLHVSQFYSFSGWLLSSNTAAGLKLYNPREYGLYSTTVGDDTSTDTIFDHIVLYDAQEQAARDEENARREEWDNAAAAAEQARQDALQAHQEAMNQQQLASLELRLRQRRLTVAVFVLSCVASAAVTWLILDHKTHRKEKKI